MQVTVAYFGPFAAHVSIRYTRFHGSKALNYAIPFTFKEIDQMGSPTEGK
jgi:hypothetical protein